MNSSSEENGGKSQEKTRHQHQQPEDESVRSCKRKLALTSLESYDSAEAQDSEKKHPESPPPAKRWVIGPLFQSFRSKMASFTEIVMSPVRLFTEHTGALNTEDPSGAEGEEADVVRNRAAVVQRLKFDHGSDRQHGTARHAGSEKQSDSIPEGNDSFRTLTPVKQSVLCNDPGSENGVYDPTSASGSSQGASSSTTPESEPRSSSLTFLTEHGGKKEPDSLPIPIRTSPGKASESQRAEESSDLSCELPENEQNRAIIQDPSQNVAAFRGRKRRDRETSEGAEDVGQVMKSQTVTLDRSLTASKRQRVLVSDGVPGSTGDAEMSRIEFGCSEMLSRTRSRRNDTKCTPPAASGDSKHTPAPKKPPASKNRSSRGVRVRRGVDAFEDQGMSMSLMLKVGPEVDEDVSATSRGLIKNDTEGNRERVMDHVLTENDDGFENLDLIARKSSRADKQRRRCVTSEMRMHVLGDQNVQEPAPVSNRLKRSLSCPDISSLRPSTDHTLPFHPPSPKQPTHPRPCSPLKRERRHTVCSLEIEREIAPLCLRKEVYPNWAGPSGSARPHSPSKSLAALVSCFLSSPLAFLSERSSRRRGDDSTYGSTLSFSKITNSPSTSFTSAFSPDAAHTPEDHALSSHSSVFDSVPTPAEDCGVHQESGEHDLATVASEEKALSDPDVKTVRKQIEGKKVSAIRIRKTLPKPQYNLTPMGLPKAVRVKKKVFSVEEIYTNKNFTSPPEGRLETIFEAPLSRRDGSESFISLKRMKRFIDFPELGVARKPKRPPIGGAGGAQRKGAGNSGAGRTRRGVWASSREESLLVQDSDSLLCSKLTELDTWMIREQMVN
ncbi:uncharacterized protein prr14 [Trichomycterus rosablanca]|uniref:uncharacterized protein prr14 n=1 Tax=Trichomycterus rosablanca TaxID=2290929 RepID=UPI002F35A5E0